MSRPIRVLHVIGNMNRGGAESFMMSLYNAIDRTRVQFDFVVHTSEKCGYDDEIRQLGGMIYRVPRFRVFNLFAYIRAWRRFFAEHGGKYDIVHGHIGSSAAIYLQIAKKAGCRTIAHSHGTKSERLSLKSLLSAFFVYPTRYIADMFFACSAQAGIDRYGKTIIQKNNFKIINNAIDTKKFAFNAEARELKRKELGIGNCFVIGHVGRMSAEKNHMFILNIFKEIRAKNKNAMLLLVGDGAMRKEIEAYAKLLGLDDYIIFTGVCLNINELLWAMDAFVFPSLWEGLGIALIEAQAAGLFCVCSDAVPPEARASDLLEYISLDDSANHWADRVLAAHALDNEKPSRHHAYKSVADSGYEIVDVAKNLAKIYEG